MACGRSSLELDMCDPTDLRTGRHLSGVAPGRSAVGGLGVRGRLVPPATRAVCALASVGRLGPFPFLGTWGWPGLATPCLCRPLFRPQSPHLSEGCRGSPRSSRPRVLRKKGHLRLLLAIYFEKQVIVHQTAFCPERSRFSPLLCFIGLNRDARCGGHSVRGGPCGFYAGASVGPGALLRNRPAGTFRPHPSFRPSVHPSGPASSTG